MQVTYFGTTMLLFDDGLNQVLFDCHVTRPSIFQCLFGKLDTDVAVANQILTDFDFSRLKAIFISHSHHDHVLDAPYFAKKTSCDVYGSSSTIQVCLGQHVNKEKLHCFEPNQLYQIGDMSIQVIPSVHSKAHWYNNDLGKQITQPFTYPARKSHFKEGGSFDFIIRDKKKTYVIRPSYNYLKDQFNNQHCDVLFLGSAGLSKADEEERKQFFAETIEKLQPQLVIPIHYDNFFVPLYGPIRQTYPLMENTGLSIHYMSYYCSQNKTHFLVIPPLGSIELD